MDMIIGYYGCLGQNTPLNVMAGAGCVDFTIKHMMDALTSLGWTIETATTYQYSDDFIMNAGTPLPCCLIQRSGS